jgi:hypothetical protein
MTWQNYPVFITPTWAILTKGLFIVILFNVAAALNLVDLSDLLTKGIKDFFPLFHNKVKKSKIKKR